MTRRAFFLITASSQLILSPRSVNTFCKEGQKLTLVPYDLAYIHQFTILFNSLSVCELVTVRSLPTSRGGCEG